MPAVYSDFTSLGTLIRHGLPIDGSAGGNGILLGFHHNSHDGLLSHDGSGGNVLNGDGIPDLQKLVALG
mgnify:CR=1 FL=1